MGQVMSTMNLLVPMSVHSNSIHFTHRPSGSPTIKQERAQDNETWKDTQVGLSLPWAVVGQIEHR